MPVENVMDTKSRYSNKIEKILKSLSLPAKIAQLDLALATTLPRFQGVTQDRFLDILNQKGTPTEIIDILSELQTFKVIDDNGNYCQPIAERLLIENSFGSIWGLSQAGNPNQNHWAANRLQEISRNNSVSKIPLLIVEEGLHGLLARDSTVFPQAIAIGATFSPDLAAEVGFAIGQEAVMRGVNTIFSPVLDLALDARWGRCEETFGSDPHLVSEMGAAMVRGLRKAGVAPIIKHFCGHGWVCGGRDSNDNALSIRELRRLHLIPFKKAVEAGALGIMSAYHAIDGLPCTANNLLLTKIIRGEWLFKGLTISDAGSVEDLQRKYGIVSDLKSAFQLAFNAGLDVHNNGPWFQENILSLLEEGKIDPKDLDQSVARVLYVKEQLGLLDEKQGEGDFKFNEDSWVSLRRENSQLAKRVALNCLTLLKNQDQVLPLTSSKYNKVLVVGDIADDQRALLGDYSRNDAKAPSIIHQINTKTPPGIEVIYASGLNEISSVIDESDLLIFVVGERSGFNTGALSGEGCDRSMIELPESQRGQIQAGAKSGKPIVLIVLAGRPLALEEENSLASALLYCYYPGEAGAEAIADILFGESSPRGNLPYDLPRRTGQVPIFYHQLPSGRSREYCDLEGTPLYPFGHGLRYTSFVLSDLNAKIIKEAPDPAVQISLTVKNSGSSSSDALVQLYCRDIVASVITPEKRLVAFKKVGLQAGEERLIKFELGFDAFALLDTEHNWIVEHGEFDILAGLSSEEKSSDVRILL